MAIFGHLFLDSHRFLVILLLFLRLQGRVTQEIAGSCVSPKPPTAEDCQIHIQAALQEILEHRVEPKDESHPSEETTLESASDQIEEEIEELSPESLEEEEEESTKEETEGTTEDDDETEEHDEVGKEEEENEDEEEDYEESEEEAHKETERTDEETEKEAEHEDYEEEEEKEDDEDLDTEHAPKEEEAKETIPEEEEEEEEEDDDEEEGEEEEDEEEGEEEDVDESMETKDDIEIPVEEESVQHEEEEEESEEDAGLQEEEAETQEEDETPATGDIDDDEEEQDEEEEAEEEEEEEEEEIVKEKEMAEEEQDEKEEEKQDDDVSEEEKQEESESYTEEIGKESSAEVEVDEKSEEYKSTTEETSQPPEGNKTTIKDPFDKMPEEPSEEAYIIGAGMAQELSAEDSQADQPAAAEEESTEEEETEEEEEELATKEDEDEDETEELTTPEEDDESKKPKIPLRDREHIDELLGLNEIGTQYDKEDQEFIRKILDELKKIYEYAVKPLEMIYKFRDISTRLLGDAEIYAKPMVLFVGPWSSGKSSIINYLLNTERTSAALKTGPEPTDVDFTLIKYGDTTVTMAGSELAADWAFSSVQKFGQGFLEHFKGIQFSHRLLQKLTLVDTPGIMENRKPQDRGYPFNDALQWFIDRADVIYVVLDPSKLEIGSELESLLDQLKGREAQIRFVLNKADTIRRSDIMKVIGQLFWNLSPLMGSSEAPVIYAVSLMTKPFHPGSPAKFLLDQEMTFLNDLRETIDKLVENRLLFARRHAVRVRNHAKMVDCYLSTYYKHKSIFSNRKKIADQITENPDRYSIYQGLSTLTNVSRYDLPDPDIYREFFNLHPLYDFKPLQSTCSYFRGCPLDKLDIAISYDLPDMLKKFKKHFNRISNSEKEEKSR